MSTSTTVSRKLDTLRIDSIDISRALERFEIIEYYSTLASSPRVDTTSIYSANILSTAISALIYSLETGGCTGSVATSICCAWIISAMASSVWRYVRLPRMNQKAMAMTSMTPNTAIA
jgi:hypothetical protein